MAEKPPIDVNPQSWLIVRSILKKYVPDRDVWAFGSRAKWTAKEFSDLDIAIVGNKSIDPSLMAALKEDFQDSALPFKVDVVDCATITPSFRKVVETDRVVIQLSGQPSDGTGWPYVRLGDYCDKIGSGATPKGGKEVYLSDGSYRLIRSQNIYNEGFKYDGLAYISPEQAKKLDGVTVNAGDVLLNITGDSVARVCTAPRNVLPARVNQHVAIIRPAQKAFDARFIRYYLAAAQQQELLFVMASSGATRDALTKGMIEDLRIPKPSLEEQRSIADILASLDNRIALLRETNATLEAITQALFKSWFVDFDPVHAKAQGIAPEGLDEATAALFPDGFEESKLGLVPRGWHTSAVYDLAQYINGAAYKAFEPNSEQRGLPIIKIAELKAGITKQTGYSDVSMPEKYRIATGDILFSWSGNPDTSIDTFIWLHGDAWLNQHIFRVVPSASSERSFVLMTLKYLNPVFAEIARNKQTTGLGHVTVADLKRLRVVKPNDAVLQQWNEIVEPLIERAFNVQQQVQTLATLRDALLPRLISGQLRIPDVEGAAP